MSKVANNLNEMEQKIGILERANFDLKMQLYYLNKKIAEQSTTSKSSENEELMANLIEDNSIDVLALKVENDTLKRRVAELETEVLQLRLILDRKNGGVANLRIRAADDSLGGMLSENRKMEKEASLAVAEHDEVLISRLRNDVRELEAKHRKDVQTLDEMAAKLSAQNLDIRERNAELSTVREEFREQVKTVSNLREIIKQQELQMTKSDQLSFGKVQEQKMVIDSLREIVTHLDTKMQEQALSHGQALAAQQTLIQQQQEKQHLQSVAQHSATATPLMSQQQVSLNSMREIIRHQEKIISSLSNRQSEIQTPSASAVPSGTSRSDADSSIRMNTSLPSSRNPSIPTSTQKPTGLEVHPPSTCSMLDNGKTLEEILRAISSRNSPVLNQSITNIATSSCNSINDISMVDMYARNERYEMKDSLNAVEVEAARKENRLLKEQLELLKSSIKNQQDALDRYRLSAGDLNILENEEVSRLEAELEKCNEEKDRVTKKFQKLEVKYEILRQKYVELRENALVRGGLSSFSHPRDRDRSQGSSFAGLDDVSFHDETLIGSPGTLPAAAASGRSNRRDVRERIGNGSSSAVDSEMQRNLEMYKQREAELLQALEGVINRCQDLERSNNKLANQSHSHSQSYNRSPSGGRY